MTCEACGKDLERYPCACGYQPKTLVPVHPWLIQHCSTSGCTVAIRIRAGQQVAVPICQWCASGKAIYFGKRSASSN